MKKKKNTKKRSLSIKGVSPVVATIILIMIVIIIAILIILWFKVFFKEIVLKEVGGNSQQADSFCKDIQLKATANPDGSIAITNQGNVPIYGIVKKISYADGSSENPPKQLTINPGNSQTISAIDISSSPYTQLELIPVLLGKKKGNLLQPVTCPEKYAIKIK